MASDQPFQLLFEVFGRQPTAHAESVNRIPYEALCETLSVPVEKLGRCILLRAPRAGHGKTHLLSRVQYRLLATHEFIPLQAAAGYRIDAVSVIDDTLRRLVRALPASGGLSVLDLVTRRLFSAGLQPLVRSGEVPCQDREGALSALQNRPGETFDFHHPNAVTAHWAQDNFDVLGPRLSLELAQRGELPLREVSFWVEALFQYASTPVDQPGRARALSEKVFGDGVMAEGEAMERLSALLGLLSSLMRVVLVADDLEGFSADETAALRFAAFLSSLRQSVERLDVILSLNQDIWSSAFVPRLSGGLVDRLSEVVIELPPLSHTDMIALLESRVPGMGEKILSQIDPRSAGTHSRGLIRAAAQAWKQKPPGNVPVVAFQAAPLPVTDEAAEPPAPLPQVDVWEEMGPAFAEPVVAEDEGFIKSEALPMEPEEPIAPLVASLISPPEKEVPVEESATAVETPPHEPAPEIASTPFVKAPEKSPFRAAPPDDVVLPATVVVSKDQGLPFPPAVIPPPRSSLAARPQATTFDESEPFVLTQSTVIPLHTPTPFTEEPLPPAEAPAQEVKPVVDTDRVDELLRQFRERYGRGSL